MIVHITQDESRLFLFVAEVLHVWWNSMEHYGEVEGWSVQRWLYKKCFKVEALHVRTWT